MNHPEDVSDPPQQEELIVRAATSHMHCANTQAGTVAQKAYRDAGLIWSQLSSEGATIAILEATLMLYYRFPNSAYIPEMLFLTAEVCYKQERYEQAIQFWTLIAEGHPDSTFSSPALLKMAKTYHVILRNPDKALEAYQQCISRHPETAIGSEAILLKGMLLEEEGEYPEAFQAYYAAHLKTVKTIISDEALYHAIRIQDRYLQNPAKAYALLIEFRKTYPQSPYREQVEALAPAECECVRNPSSI